MASVSSVMWGGTAVNINSTHGQYPDWPACIPCENCYGFVTAPVEQGGRCMSCGHPGVDINLVYQRIKYLASGTIVYHGCTGSYRPYEVRVQTDSGYVHIYGHMSSLDRDLRPGDRVTAGEWIGVTGEQTVRGSCNPGDIDGSGPHLHFEVLTPQGGRGNGCAIDPIPFLQAGFDYGSGGGGTPPPPNPNPGQVRTYGNGDLLQVTQEGHGVNLRARPGLSTGLLIPNGLDAGSTLCRTALDPEYVDGYHFINAYTNFNGQLYVGWLAAEYVSLKTPAPNSTCNNAGGGTNVANVGDTVYNLRNTGTSSDYLNVREGPGSNYDLVGRMSPNHEHAFAYCVKDVRPSELDGTTPWYRIAWPPTGRDQWISSSFLSIHQRNHPSCAAGGGGEATTSLGLRDRLRVTENRTAIRTEPATTGRVVAELARGDKLCVTAKARNGSRRLWIGVSTDNDVEGWVEVSRVELLEATACGRSAGSPVSPKNLLTNPTAANTDNVQPVNGASVQIATLKSAPTNKFFKVTGSRQRRFSGMTWDTPGRLKQEGGKVTANVSLRAAQDNDENLDLSVWLEVFYIGENKPQRGGRSFRVRVSKDKGTGISAPTVRLEANKKVDYVRLNIVSLNPTDQSWYVDNGDIHFN